jgi:DNA-binding SARP family transcriptional activator
LPELLAAIHAPRTDDRLPARHAAEGFAFRSVCSFMAEKKTALRRAEQRAFVLGKLTRPRPVGALPRARLFRALDLALRHPVAWVSGPPGSGKTTLASTYVAERRLRTLWYRLQDDDADPATFFHYFGLALEAAAPGRGRTPLPHLTPEYLASLGVFSRRYFERAWQRLKAPCVIVFDNCEHSDRDGPLCEVMRELIESLPEGIRVVMLCRADPPPSFATLRARGAIAFIGAEQLKLTEKECGELAELREVPLAKPALHRLHERTQGWTAGVVLALEQKAPAPAENVPPPEASPQLLFDYFAGEIFDKMAPEVQALLLRAAFLPSMAAYRVVELTGLARAGQVLGELARTGYFTLKLAPVHGAPPAVYQFHPLFREFLLRRAQETLAPAALDEVRRKAAALLEADGDTADAIALLLAARDWEAAMRVMFSHAHELLQQGRGRILEAWLRALPQEARGRSAWALYWLGRCRLGYDPAEARGHFEQAFALFEPGEDAEGLFSTWASLVDTFVYEWGDFAPLDRWIAVLDALLARHGELPTPETEARVAAGMLAALMYRQPHRPDLPQWAARARLIALATPDARTRMLLGNQLVHYYTAWLGDLPTARLLIEAIRPTADPFAAGPLAHIARCAMEATYHWYVGAHEECLRLVNEGLETTRRYGARFTSLLETLGIYAHLTAGDLAAAERLLKESAATALGGRLYRAHGHFLSFACALYRRDFGHALAAAREAVALAEATGAPHRQAMYRSGLALALFLGGERREALRVLAEARRIARHSRSPNIEFSCLYLGAWFLLERGKERRALPLLRRTLAIARSRGYRNRLFWTTEISTRLFAAALEHGIEVPYVEDLIRRRRLVPAPHVSHLERWPFPVRIYTLGRFAVLIDGKPLEFSGKAQRKPLELLMALVAFGARDVSEQRLTEALWPQADGDAAHQACAAALHRLRKLLGCDEAVRLQRNHFSLDPRFVWVDLWAFERGALALYQGPFLGEQAEAGWAIPLRERLHARYVRHVAERGRALLAAGEYSAAIAALERGLNVDPLAEELYQALMLCYQALDRRAEAIKVYQRCEKTLAASLGVAPGGKTVALYQSLHG